MNKPNKKFSIKNGFKPFYINSWKFRIFVILMFVISISVLDYLEEKNFGEIYTYVSIAVFSISLICLSFTGLIRNLISYTGNIEINSLDSILGYEDKKAKSLLFNAMVFAIDLLVFLLGITILIFQIIVLIFL